MLGTDVYGVILAGGSGTRFWPKSRQKVPKQLCQIGDGDKTMLEITLDRIEGFIPPERRLIVTHKDQVELTRKIVGERCPKIIAEPEARNTSAALAIAALEIEASAPQGLVPIMVSLHADHVIRDVEGFKNVMRDTVQTARRDKIALFGVVPSFPETGFGYIERGEKLDFGTRNKVFRVQSFREKPPLELAKEFVASGRFYWNAGLFTWKTGVILAELAEKQPLIVSKLKNLLGSRKSFLEISPEAMAETYKQLPKIAIDHAVLELSQNVTVVEADIGWADVGSWSALTQNFTIDRSGNYVSGDYFMLDCKNTTIDTDGPLIATIGLEDMIVVHAKGAILVCPRERAQDVKKIVEWLTEQKRTELL